MNTVHDFQFPVQQPQSNVILDNTVPENRLRVTVLGTVVIYLLWAYLLWLTMTELDVGMIFANSCHSSSDSCTHNYVETCIPFSQKTTGIGFVL